MFEQVDGLPGYVLEPDSRGVRELNVQSFENVLDGNNSGVFMMTTDSTVTLSNLLLRPTCQPKQS